jgi:hypothetical protein
VSLGNSYLESIASARLIKDFELHRTLTLLKDTDDPVDNNKNTSICWRFLVLPTLICEDLEDDDDLERDEALYLPPSISKDRRVRKKSRTIRKICRGVIVLESKLRNLNDKFKRINVE